MSELTFEESLQKLEEIVKRLERGDVPLNEAIEAFNEGMKLASACNSQLKSVEEQMTLILNEQNELETFKLKSGE